MQNVLNALRVLEEVADRQPVGVTDLARAMGLPKSSVQRALVTLHTAEWIQPAGDTPTRWAVTTKALHVGRRAAGELGLRDAAVPVMEELRRRTDETVHLAVPEGGKVVLIERLETAQPVRIVLPLGQILPLHASSNGKAVLAASPDEVVERYIAEGLPGFTGTTITDPGRLRTELAGIRARGYAANRGEWRADVSAVAAAVVGGADRDGLPVASVSVNVPTSRMTDASRSAFGALVAAAAKTLGDVLARRRAPDRDTARHRTP
ncbi:IclR family transcriptional regulator [Streptomyces sp. UNOC14_S4]|uniref:IclR family transcriptional regulator n=1 Tax=Streptomyces sp. UNOC14_S4 TaxID=2872340 RepID=UPI001E42593E|nr:IclR family transcriptional regulator [Streptomyces sp. UNOC14_S4]MCC3766157.1 IclR family transcriptional regulator [Streptomyces sp. UNOC14_S4]